MNPNNKLTIIGGGIIGALEAYYAILDAKVKNQSIRITINEKNEVLSQTTTGNIAPSLTPDEIMAVVPRGEDLVNKLKIIFSETGGIRVDDLPGLNERVAAKKFIDEVKQYGLNDSGHKERSRVLLGMGKHSMDLWQGIYDNADSTLKQIMEESNFHPCQEPKNTSTETLQDGYRIDVIYKDPNAKTKAVGMINEYRGLGYHQCKMLTPDQVKALDPSLTAFCENQSEVNAPNQERQWNNDAVAVYRPGGCIATDQFLPKFYGYLKSLAGTYVNKAGVTKDCFRLKMGREITELLLDAQQNRVIAFQINQPPHPKAHENPIWTKLNKHDYENSDYVLCPGEQVDALQNLKLNSPAYARFAGASLKFKIAIPNDQWDKYARFNHCMEVHQQGIVLAWQARVLPDEKAVSIIVAGTKAFYADQKPSVDQAFAKNRNVLQINMVNDILFDLLSLPSALNRNTKGQTLTAEDLQSLVNKGVVKRWAGTRAVAYDGFPTLGPVYNANGQIPNTRVTTHLGSGGVSFGPAAVLFSRSAMINVGHHALHNMDGVTESICNKAVDFSSSRRKAV